MHFCHSPQGQIDHYVTLLVMTKLTSFLYIKKQKEKTKKLKRQKKLIRKPWVHEAEMMSYM
jgi:hypothetical protein